MNKLFIDGSPAMRIVGNKLHYMLGRPDSLKFNKDTILYLRKPLKLANQQETSRFFTKIAEGSSETTREATFNFVDFYKSLPLGFRKPSINFLHWFVGFSEGVGDFTIDSNNRLFFTIEQNDIKTLFTIKKELGFGKVSVFHDKGRFIVSDLNYISRLIYIFNGNILLKRTKILLNSWILAYNLNIPEKPIIFKDNFTYFRLLENYWLSGFLTVFGFFSASMANIGKKDQVFDAKIVVEGEIEILQIIANNFNSGYISNTINKNFIIDTRDGLKKIIVYLDKYKTYHYSKYISYFKWRKYINAAEALYFNERKVSIDKLIRLANSINKLKI